MASIYSGSDAGKSGLELVELDGSPDVRGVTKIKVSNTTLTDDGNGEVTLQTGGGGGGGGMTSWTLRGNSGSNQTISDADNVTFSGGGGLTTVASAVDTLTVQTVGVLEDLNTLGAPTADGEFIVATGAGAFAYETGVTVRNSLGLGTMATQDANAVAITGGTITGVSGLAAPSVGSANQLNVSDGSGGWDTAALYYGTSGSGQLGVGKTIGGSSYTLQAFNNNGSNIARFQTNQTTGIVEIEATGSSVFIKSTSNRMTLTSNGIDFAIPTADGSNGDVLTTDGNGDLSFTTPTGGGVTLSGSTNNTISTVTGANALQGEANLTFDGTLLTVTGNLSVGVDPTSTVGFYGATPVIQQVVATPYSPSALDPTNVGSLAGTTDLNLQDIAQTLSEITQALQAYGLLQ